jgi:Xaa-Pro aminopeptidase
VNLLEKTDARPPPGEDRKLSPVSRAELERRWALVRAHLRERQIGALVAQSTRDFHGGYVRWFTDVPAGNPRTVIFHADDLMTVVDHGPAGRRRTLSGDDPHHPGVGELITTAAFSSAHYTQTADAEAVVEMLRRRGHRRIGLVGAASTAHAFVAHVTENLAGASEISDETDAVDRFKAIKSVEEIAAIRATAQMQDAVFAKVLAQAQPGMRDFEITALARYEGERAGSEQGLFLAASSPLGRPAPFAARHGQGRTIRPGDHLTLLIENNGFGGFYTELARIIVFGKASPELHHGFQSAAEAQANTVKQLKPGTAARDIAPAHDAFMRSRGLPLETRLYAHSQGYDLVERPLIRTDETMTLAAGMSMAVHPTYATGAMFMVVCDNFLVGDQGPSERLHTTPQTIFEL